MPSGSGYENIPVAGGDTARPLALGKRLQFIEPHLVPGRNRFLDCGCGAGDYVFELIRRFKLDAWGVEFEAKKVAQGQAHPEFGGRISQGDIQRLPHADGEWDYAMLNEVLEHVPDDVAGVREVHRILKPGGLLFVFSPNRWYPFESHGVKLKRSGRQLSAATPFIPYIPMSIGRNYFDYWARNYWPGELRKLLATAGFKVVETGYVWQTFEGISGGQPRLIAAAKPVLRGLADLLQVTPFLRRFGVSQALVCRK
jgi:SAM-dependent methyltransferase